MDIYPCQVREDKLHKLRNITESRALFYYQAKLSLQLEGLSFICTKVNRSNSTESREDAFDEITGWAWIRTCPSAATNVLRA